MQRISTTNPEEKVTINKGRVYRVIAEFLNKPAKHSPIEGSVSNIYVLHLLGELIEFNISASSEEQEAEK